tara:strand:+ start:698 stop:1063 length:366 start_codon:yes stop_codon:yes gene_type:complete
LTFYFYLLVVKHAIADLWLQSRLDHKKHYGEKNQLLKPKLWLHSLDHAVLTCVVTLIFAGLYWAVIIAILDFVLHSIIDYSKHIYTIKYKINSSQNKFWKVQTIDQIAHFSCYLLYVIMVY